MEIRCAQSALGSVQAKIEDIASQLELDARGRPDFLVLHFGADLDAAALREEAIARTGAEFLHGGSSCLGVMGNAGADISGSTLGAFAIWDSEGSYGTSSAELGDDAEAAARNALVAALMNAGRPDELPEMIWLTVAPGREEDVISGLRSIVGPESLIVGGSSADNDVSGKWIQFSQNDLHSDGIVVSVLFPSGPVSSAYHSGYAPTGENGIATRVEGRRLHEIDGRPALQVLNEWSSGAIPIAGEEQRSILAESTLWPFGRVVREIASVPFHILAHPAVANPDGSVDLFAAVKAGDQLWQMRGSADSLVARAGRVAARANRASGENAAGALVVYCGGCMLAVRDRMDEVSAGISAELGDKPWLGVFTFGEQGVPAGGESRHGNLMISCTMFAKPDL